VGRVAIGAAAFYGGEGALNCSLVERHLVPRRRTWSIIIYVACQHHRNTQRRHRGKGGRQGGGGMVLSVASWRGSRASLLAKGEGRACRRHHESQGEKRGLREAKVRRGA
jgi:hypothetical protein